MLARPSRLYRKAVFIYPISPAPRTAVLLPGFRSRGAIRVFSGGWSEDVRRFAPAAVAVSLAQIDGLIHGNIASLTHAVIVLGLRREPRLTEADRERIWKAFRVPVFEQIIGEDSQLLAQECEAHAGLHIESGRLSVTGYRIDESPCGCGRGTPRLVSAEPAGVLRRVAAYAR